MPRLMRRNQPLPRQRSTDVTPPQDGRIYIEKLNGPFLFGDKGTLEEYAAGLSRAIARGWLELHDSGTFVKLTQGGADLFA